MESEWQVHPLKEICSKIGSGATPRGGNSVYLDDGEFALIRSQNVRNESFDHSGLAFIEKHHAEKLSNVAVEDKDVLLNITGDSVARCCQVDPKVLPARVNQHVAIIRPEPEILDPLYLRYYFVSPLMQNEMLSLAGVGATRNALTKGMIEGFEIPLPPLPEQKAIAHILGTLDDKIEANRRMNATLEGMAQALFKSWFVDFDPVIDNALAAGNPVPEALADRAEIRRQAIADGTANREAAKTFPDSFQETEAMGWIPEGWEVKPLGEESIILNGYAFKSEDYCEDGIFVLRTKNFDANGLSSRRGDDVFLPDSFSDSHESYLSQPFDFHLVMVGASIGKTSLLLPHMLPALRNQNMWCFRPKAQSMSKIFLNLSVQKKVEEVMSWASGSARSFFRKSDFRSHEILIPTKELLAQFEETVGPMYLKISSGSAETDQLTKLRDTSLPKLISGELRVTEAEQLTKKALA